MRLRIVCVDVDHGRAANVGGPVMTFPKTFDMDAPEELKRWLDYGRQWHDRFIEHVEILPGTSEEPMAHQPTTWKMPKGLP